MYSLDLKTVDKLVYRTENSSIQAKVSHGELAKIRSRPAGLNSLSRPRPSWSGRIGMSAGVTFKSWKIELRKEVFHLN
jgi:hypothetical protein